MEPSSPSKGATPLPWRRLAVLLPAFMADAFAVTVVFPFLPFMVQAFFQFPSEEQYKIGYYAGLLGGSYECGQILSSPLWGMLADRIGRRPAIMICMLLGSCLMLAFGCSSGFWAALVLRFTQGLVNGTQSVGRTYLADITDTTNDAAAFALVGILWGVGDIVGPAIGGLLADPARHYPGWYAAQPDVLRRIVETFPYVLPCAVVSAFGLVDLLFISFALPETVRARTPAAGGDEGVDESGGVTSGLRKMLGGAHPALRLVCLISMLFGTTIGAFDQTVPVWARDQLGASEVELGYAQSVSGIVSMVASFLLITRLVSALGASDAMGVSLLLVGLGYAMPAVDIGVGVQGHTRAAEVFLLATYGIKALGCESCFTGVSLLVKRHCPPEMFGVAQGIGNGFVSIGMAVGPLWGPSLFAFSVGCYGPSAGAVAFVVLFALSVVAALLARMLPPEIGSSAAARGAGELCRPLVAEEGAGC